VSYIDISVSLHSSMPIWPGSTGFHRDHVRHLARGDQVTESRVNMDVHSGTHIDAPAHFLLGGTSVEDVDMEVLIGPTQVVDIPERIITDTVLSENCPTEPGERLLLRTPNSLLWERGETGFQSDFAALTPRGAEWVVDHGIRLVGIDYLSIQLFEHGPQTHRILLGAGVVVLEGLNLAEVAPGRYELLCLPLRILGAEGAPARALLKPLP
jgi:arylformamidase